MVSLKINSCGTTGAYRQK